MTVYVDGLVNTYIVLPIVNQGLHRNASLLQSNTLICPFYETGATHLTKSLTVMRHHGIHKTVVCWSGNEMLRWLLTT